MSRTLMILLLSPLLWACSEEPQPAVPSTSAGAELFKAQTDALKGAEAAARQFEAAGQQRIGEIDAQTE